MLGPMDDGCTSPGAVELPARRVALLIGRRRHRAITGMSGAVLFACLFLPAVRGCDSSVYPIEMPIFLHPYLYGLAFAIGAGTITTRGMRVTIGILRALGVVAVAGGVVLTFVAPPLGLVEELVGAGLLAAIGARGYSERRAAATAIVAGVASTLWFGCWAMSVDALIGVYVSLVGALGLLAGGLVWLGELSGQPPSVIALPHAVARPRE